MIFFNLLNNADKWLFTFIHRTLANNLLDAIMLFLRNGIVWIPLYIVLLWWIVRRHKTYAFKFIALSIVTVAFTDYVSASILKPLFERPRPCFDATLQPIIRHIIDCGGLYSFPSSHASNHFGMATFWFWSIFIITGKRWHWLWLWAGLICFAQVYVGKHYPFDILGGTLLGWLSGIGSAKIFELWIKAVSRNARRNMHSLGAATE